ncbi:hypothetical protein M0805_005805 [Coniferiporia weirii]|nr:hypothetical protein M0805_005805 [Coniferiporia weirii]
MDASYESFDSHYLAGSQIGDASYDGPEDADLSLSELSLNEKPGPPAGPSQPFSLLARPSQPPEPDIAELQDDIEDEVGNETELPRDEEAMALSMARTREDRLGQDLFVLRKLNSGLAMYNDALGDTRSSAERVADQLKQTNALLDKYINLLAKSEAVTRLIFDERWHGADDDEAAIEKAEREAEEKIRREAEERARAERLEKERIEREESERQERAERERIEAEKKEKLAMRAGYGRVRGVRGTRASMRARGGAVPRAAAVSASARGRVSSIPTVAGTTSRISRPASSTSTSTVPRSGIR